MKSSPIVAILGIPFDDNSSFLRGSAAGPDAIREKLHSGSSNLTSESGLDLERSTDWEDVGDVEFSKGITPFDAIHKHVELILRQERRILALGGDHSILYPVMMATAKKYDELTVIHIDAHPDLYDELDGNRFSHACPAARIMESCPNVRMVQVGIRTLNAHQRAQAEKFGVEIVTAEMGIQAMPVLDGPLYVSLDLDVLDPAFAPGVSHHEPGGFSTREVLRLLGNLPDQIVGADIVELNPSRDVAGITAAVGAKMLKELLAKMLRS